MRTKWSIHQEINSTQFKTLLGDMDDDLVMVPFTNYSWNDTKLLDFNVN
jgi:hypothetical protein